MKATSIERLKQQLEFVLELDRLKTVLRQTEISDCSRRENSGEHSWHVALMALVLHEHANSPVNPAHVAKMLLIHDVVEIDAGDTFLYDESGNAKKEELETRAAERIFGLLPHDQAGELRQLWDEFEVGETPEAKFARAIDRLAPCLLNVASKGSAWVKNGISYDQAFSKNSTIAEGSESLWAAAQEALQQAKDNGYLGE